ASAISAVNGPARRTFIRSLLPPDKLTAGLALDRLSFQVVLIAGPALAGLIAAAPGLGLRGCYLIDTASFAGSLYGVARLPRAAAGAGTAATGAGAGRPGLRAVA